MRKRRQVVAMLLTVAMSVTLLPTEIQAARENSKQNILIEEQQDEVTAKSKWTETDLGGQWVTEKSNERDTFDLPDIIEQKEAEEKGYIGRVREEEKDLNTFVFKNSDGTNTMRVYDYPVKYVDKDGNIKDITTDVEKRYDGAYETKDNDIKTVFSKYFGQGISLKSDNVDIELVPRGKDNASMYASGHISAKVLDEKTVSYFYGTNTTLEYGLTYTGFKEDIVVSEYTGQTEYEFTLKTKGLYLSEEDGAYYLVDEAGEVQATIGDIIIFTADEANNTMGSMSSITIEDGQEYLLTIHVDAEYLKDEKTVYPIRIDPTIEINYDNNGAGAIQDVTICSSTTQKGTSGSLYIGKRSGYGICRVLMKFPTLNLSNIHSSSNIISATVELRDLMCETTAATIQCYVYNGVSWSESTAIWSNVSSSGYATLLSSNSVSYANGKKQATAHRYKFDIKGAVEAWKSNTYVQDKSIMFKADSSVENGSTYNYKTFASYNRASYKPSLSITYNGFDGAETIVVDEIKSVQIKYAEEQKYFKFVPQSTGFYSFTSSNRQSTDPYAWLYNVDKKQLNYSDDVLGERNFRITYHLEKGKVYYFVTGCRTTGIGNYNVQISKCKGDISGYATENKGDKELDVTCNYKQKALCYKYIPKDTKDYLFYSSDAEGNPRIWIYNSNLQLIAENNDGAAYRNFYLSTKLYAGSTYYIVVAQYDNNVGKCKLNILGEATGLKETCYIKNVGNLKYVDIEGPITQEWVHQWDGHADMQEKWLLARQADGYYVIRSEYGKKYYIGISNTDITTDNIKLYSTISDSTKWKIYEYPTGEMLLEPKTAKGRVLYAPNSNTGAQLQLINLCYNVSNRDKWEVQNVGEYFSQINSYFDNGYTIFYEETRAESIETINSCMKQVCDKFFDLFELRILYDSAKYYQSPIDICKKAVSSGNIDTLCNHNGVSHTELESVLSDFSSKYPGSIRFSNILWSGHLIKTPAYKGDTTTNRSVSTGNTVLMLKRSEGLNIESRLAKTLMHELCHQFGAKDHYHDVDKDGNCRNEAICTKCKVNLRPEECTMYDPEYDKICAYCMKDIINHLNEHHKN